MPYDSFLKLDIDRFYPEPTNEQFILAYFNRLYMRLHVYNFSLLLVWYGPHRSGKSLSAVAFSTILDPTFEDHMEERIVYSTTELKAQSRHIRDKGIKGAAIIYDEAGSGDLSNQRWYEEKAKKMNAVLQSIGYLNPFINFVTQDFFFINSQARRLSQGIMECKRRNNEWANIRTFWISNDPWTTKLYHRYPIFVESVNNDAISNIYKIGRIKIGMLLKDELLLKYDEISKAFKNKLLDETENETENNNGGQGSQKDYVDISKITDIINDIISNPDPVMSKVYRGVPIINKALVQAEYKVPYHIAGAIKIKVEKHFQKNKIE